MSDAGGRRDDYTAHRPGLLDVTGSKIGVAWQDIEAIVLLDKLRDPERRGAVLI